MMNSEKVKNHKKCHASMLKSKSLLHGGRTSLFCVYRIRMLTRKSAIRVTELQNQASISRHIPHGIAAVSFQFLKGGHGV
jgi:hypothetical protein